jgi:isoleucyl-tRNA synthetase
MGGEIVRLWVASVDFREDMAASENLMQRCAELYKKLRNTFRFLLGNLKHSLPAFGIAGEFDPVRDRVPEADLLPLDRYMLARTRELTEKILGWYEAFEFHRVYQAVNEFAIVDLSAFYLDVLKDRMYTFAPSSQARRSAQTVLWQITEALVRLVAPILTFTADEVWEQLPPVADRESSVHLARFPKPEEIFSGDPAKLIDEWRVLFALRNEVLRALEVQRQSKAIGKGLDVDLDLYADEVMYDLLRNNGESLKEFFNVSKVVVHKAHGSLLNNLGLLANPPRGTEVPTNIAGLRAFVALASGTKCARCWNFMPDTADYGIWHDVCGRCRSALKEMGIAPPKPEAAQ